LTAPSCSCITYLARSVVTRNPTHHHQLHLQLYAAYISQNHTKDTLKWHPETSASPRYPPTPPHLSPSPFSLTDTPRKEYSECTSSPPPGIKVTLPNDSDLHKWHVIIDGPENTVYAGGKFGIVLSLPLDYPFRPPVLTFATRIYHPNVTNDDQGNICLGLLKNENWKPSTKIFGILEAVRGLLVEPQPDDPLEARIADEYRSDRKEFEKNARAYVQRYAKGPVKFDGGSGAAAGEEKKEAASAAAGGSASGA
jgi:ubiquitin-conjugating enzyme E2 D/E